MSEENKGIEVVKQEAGKLMAWAEGLEVRNEDDYKGAFAVVKQIKSIRKQWVDYWKPIKENAYKSWRGIKTKENEGTDLCDTAEGIAKNKAGSWRAKQEAIAEEQRRKLQAEADRRAEREKKELLKKVEQSKKQETKEKYQNEANQVIAPDIVIEKSAKVEGVSYRKKWCVELTDIDVLIKEATKPNSIARTLVNFNQQAGDKLAQSSQGAIKIEGVRFYVKTITSVRKENE